MKDIQIPLSGGPSNTVLQIEKNLVIIGANGAGKTRLGSRIEQNNLPTKRISAQRYLQLTETVQKQDFETADNQLKNSFKNQSPIQPQADYQQVLISLFAQESRRDSEYVVNSRSSEVKLDIPQSVKEKVISCWNFIFPYLTLKLENDRVRVDHFSGTEMSDGEKVGLYLISQVLLAEKDCILIIDEPELHLHRSLMVRLWNKLEEYRSDCTFIYITHDLDFAVGKPSNKLIWIKSYKDSIWEWQELDSNDVIPENLFLEMLGSRKPILFVEGEKGSLDIQIYQSYYENFTVIPCGSCEKVIEAVRGLKTHASLHDKKIYGLIDKDFRTGEQLKSLFDDGILSIELNEVENLFIVPELVEMVCNHLLKPTKKAEILGEIKKIYLENKDKVSFASQKYRMHRHLGEKFGYVKNKDDYDEFKKNIFSELDQIAIASLPGDEVEVTEILKIYPHKGLVNQLQGKVDLTKNGYKSLVLGFLSSNRRGEVLKVLALYLPDIK